MPTDATRAAVETALLGDGSLILRTDESVGAAVSAWIPRHRATATADVAAEGSAERAIVAVTSAAEAAASDSPHSAEPPTLTLGAVSACVDSDHVWLEGASGLRGEVDLKRLRAALALDPSRDAVDMHGGLTLATALLLGRMGRALVHAAAFVDPQDGGWLLVGDSHSGKTTTCATLLTAGWRYVADDQVVLSRHDDGIMAEGWPREAHLDPGWPEGRLTSTRIGVDLGAVRPEGWVPRATVKGVLFPSIEAEGATELAPVAAADSLARVIRQSPWLLADRVAAPTVLSLLTSVVAGPCFTLSLGRDSYANAERLTGCLEPITRAR